MGRRKKTDREPTAAQYYSHPQAWADAWMTPGSNLNRVGVPAPPAWVRALYRPAPPESEDDDDR